MPMPIIERDALRRKLVALKAAEEVEGVMKLVKKMLFAGSESSLRLTYNSDEWQQIASRSAPSQLMWREFAKDLEKVLDEYSERLLAMAQDEKED